MCIRDSAEAERLHERREPLLVDGPPVHEHGQRHVLDHVEDGDEVVELVDEAHLAAAEHGELLVAAGEDVLALQLDGSARGAVDAAHEMLSLIHI